MDTINRARALRMPDASEEWHPPPPYWQKEFLPRLDTGVGVVIAGRYSLGPAWASWQKFIRPLVLGGLTRQEGEVLLERRGITDPALVDQVIEAAGGLALALSLAGGIVQRLVVDRFPGRRGG